MRAGAGISATTVASAAPAVAHTAWHSLVPYLFGALAGILGLIALALLILACSFWKFSRFVEDDRENAETGVKPDGEQVKGRENLEPRVVVIMAGDQNPTFLARAIAYRANSFVVPSCSCGQKKGSNDGVIDDEKKLDGDSSVSNFTEMENQN